MTIESVVIVGAGHGGVQVAISLRQEGFNGRIVLLNDERGLPYQRAPLSKAYLLGKIGETAMLFRPQSFYDEQRIEHLHDRASHIDRRNQRVMLVSGGAIDYDHLVIATGARNRPLGVPGAELGGVYGIKTKADADALSIRVKQARDVVVVGAGFIGLEFAAVAAAEGANVEVLELGDRPMARAVSSQMSALFADAHRSWGVSFNFGTGIVALQGEDGAVQRVITSDGRRLLADLVVYGIGVVPNVELAQEAGLDTENGVRVNAELLTADPSISALGDVAAFPCVQNGGALTRLESVQNAVDQGKTIAARLVGKPAPYAALPWFWTDQGNLKLQIAGLSVGADHFVTLGDLPARQTSVLCYRGDELIAVESCNRPGDHIYARKILARPPALTRAIASAPDFDLKAWEAASRA